MDIKTTNTNRVTVCNINLTPITPIHIGGAEDQHLKLNLDYTSEEQKIRYINWEKTIAGIRSTNEKSYVMNDLKKGRINQNPRYSIQFGTQYYWKGQVGRNLRTFIKNGPGKAYLPGSSLKGALRSAMMEAYNIDKNSTKKSNELELDTIGTFSNSLFSLIQVRDADFSNSLFLCNSKIYNLDHHKEGAWKNAFRNTNERQFKEREFATMAECLMPGQTKPGQIVFQLPAFAKRKKEMNLTNRNILDRDWNADPWQWMATTARSYMQKYLEAELAYFERFNDAEYSSEIIESLKELEQFHESLGKNQFLIRMGWGSGFHQMTGNWQFPDHLKKAASGKYKSRKIAFWHSDEGLHFLPMGFLLLELQGESEANTDYPFEINKKKRSKQTPAAEEVKPAEKPKPTYADPKNLRNNSEIFAEVVGNEGKQVKVKVYIAGYEDQILQFRYAAGIEKGKIIIARIQFHRRKIKDGFNVVFLRMY